MSKLKNKIKNAFAEETPNVKKRVLSACENAVQVEPTPVKSTRISSFKILAFTLSLIITFGLGITAGNFISFNSNTIQTSLYIDVNPSIELSLNSSGDVVECTAVNDDATSILQNLNLKGVNVDTAVYTLVGALYIHGYLTEESNSVLISVDSKNSDGGDSVLQKANDQILNAISSSGINCSIISQKFKASSSDKQRADSNGVSVGKMIFIDGILSETESSSEQDLSKLTINELNLIQSINKPDNSNVSGKPNGFTNTDSIISSVLTKMGKPQADVEYATVKALPSKREGARVVYIVTVKLIGDDTIYEYEADSANGTVFDDVHPDYGHKH